ncbi:APC11 protein [Podarcis lilfordi]|uniref:Anaphase-promoting complex subunit 11 n=1 Tax=Podarcis lilfordi TaxID=74358 RepID=A0AA35JTN6_9SAUR|nr:APC11 protein [Podarcis lilfordi]
MSSRDISILSPMMAAPSGSRGLHFRPRYTGGRMRMRRGGRESRARRGGGGGWGRGERERARTCSLGWAKERRGSSRRRCGARLYGSWARKETWEVPSRGGTSGAILSFVRSLDTMKVKIKSWHGVASWLWVANDENCGICRMAFNGCCPDCKVPGDDCPLVWGQCSHCFHMHCILKWLNSQQVQQHCPMCRQEWKFKE